MIIFWVTDFPIIVKECHKVSLDFLRYRISKSILTNNHRMPEKLYRMQDNFKTICKLLLNSNKWDPAFPVFPKICGHHRMNRCHEDSQCKHNRTGAWHNPACLIKWLSSISHIKMTITREYRNRLFVAYSTRILLLPFAIVFCCDNEIAGQINY